MTRKAKAVLAKCKFPTLYLIKNLLSKIHVQRMPFRKIHFQNLLIKCLKGHKSLESLLNFENQCDNWGHNDRKTTSCTFSFVGGHLRSVVYGLQALNEGQETPIE